MIIFSYFDGQYYKHQMGSHTVCLIVGQADSGGFVQIITNEEVRQFDSLDGCTAGAEGITLEFPGVTGKIAYGPLTPLQSDIMGPFRFLPMQCRHKVVSMFHSLTGGLIIGGKEYDFTGGKGYIEGDSGRSFPKEYLWLHCNDLPDGCGIMAAVAHIPFGPTAFQGCICAVLYKGKEYRLATYRGVKILHAARDRLVLRQGSLLLEVNIDAGQAHPLQAPKQGKMVHTIHESNSTAGRFRFWMEGRLLFDLQSPNISFECELS